jgi:hypothetical protein
MFYDFHFCYLYHISDSSQHLGSVFFVLSEVFTEEPETQSC